MKERNPVQIMREMALIRSQASADPALVVLLLKPLERELKAYAERLAAFENAQHSLPLGVPYPPSASSQTAGKK